MAICHVEQGYARREPFSALTSIFAAAAPERPPPAAAASLLALLCTWLIDAPVAARPAPSQAPDAAAADADALRRPLLAWMADCVLAAQPGARTPLLQVLLTCVSPAKRLLPSCLKLLRFAGCGDAAVQP